MATQIDLAVFRERWTNTGHLEDWSDDAIACVVDVVNETRGDRAFFRELLAIEANVIDVLRVARRLGYIYFRPYVRTEDETKEAFARRVVRDLVERFPGRPAQDLFLEARQRAQMHDDDVFHAMWTLIHEGIIELSEEDRTLVPTSVAVS